MLKKETSGHNNLSVNNNQTEPHPYKDGAFLSSSLFVKNKGESSSLLVDYFTSFTLT